MLTQKSGRANPTVRSTLTSHLLHPWLRNRRRLFLTMTAYIHENPHCCQVREQRATPVADEWQRQPLGGGESHNYGAVDQSLESDYQAQAKGQTQGAVRQSTTPRKVGGS